MSHDELRIWLLVFAGLSLINVLLSASGASWLSRVYNRLDRIPKPDKPK